MAAKEVWRAGLERFERFCEAREAK